LYFLADIQRTTVVYVLANDSKANYQETESISLSNQKPVLLILGSTPTLSHNMKQKFTMSALPMHTCYEWLINIVPPHLFKY
jgi:hypothetical protein